MEKFRAWHASVWTTLESTPTRENFIVLSRRKLPVENPIHSTLENSVRRKKDKYIMYVFIDFLSVDAVNFFGTWGSDTTPRLRMFAIFSPPK